MKWYGFIIALFLSPTSLQADSKRLTEYDKILLDLVVDYVSTNSTSASREVVAFINSSATTTVFKDAWDAGYNRRLLIFSAYQSSFDLVNRNPIVTKALQEEALFLMELERILLYISCAGAGLGATTLAYLIGFSLMYFRKDRELILHYRRNVHLLQNQLKIKSYDLAENE